MCTAESDLHYPALSSTVTNITTQKKDSQVNPQEPDFPLNADSLFSDIVHLSVPIPVLMALLCLACPAF